MVVLGHNVFTVKAAIQAAAVIKRKVVMAKKIVEVAVESAPVVAAPVLVLVGVEGKVPRAGTASAATHAVLLDNVGQPRSVVLAALADAERAWHDEMGRTVKAISPAGWLKTHKAEFQAQA